MSEQLDRLLAELELDEPTSEAMKVGGLVELAATLGPLHSIDPDAPASPQPIEDEGPVEFAPIPEDAFAAILKNPPPGGAASQDDALEGVAATGPHGGPVAWENGYPTGCPLCGGRVAQLPSAENPGQPGRYLICRAHGAVWELEGGGWKMA